MAERYYLPQKPLLGKEKPSDNFSGVKQISGGVFELPDFNYGGILRIKGPDLHMASKDRIAQHMNNMGQVLNVREDPFQLYYEAIPLDRERYAQDFEQALDPDRPSSLVELGLEAADFFRHGQAGDYPPTVPAFYMVSNYHPSNRIHEHLNFWRPEYYEEVERRRAQRKLGANLKDMTLQFKNLASLESHQLDDADLFNFFRYNFYGDWAQKQPPISFPDEATAADKLRYLHRLGPVSVEPGMDYVIVHGRYFRHFLIADLPPDSNMFQPEIMLKLFNSGIPMRMSWYFDPKNQERTLADQKKERQQKGKTLDIEAARGQEEDIRLAASVQGSMQTSAEISLRGHRSFDIYGSLLVESKDYAGLSRISADIQSILKPMGVPMEPTDHYHHVGFLNTLPFGVNRFKDKNFVFPMTTDQAKKIFIMSEAQSVKPGSIYIGTNLKDNSWKTINQFDDDNENFIVGLVGPSGSGKGTLAKKMAHHHRQRGGNVIAMDTSVNKEWCRMAESMGGEVIDFSNGAVINPFDFPTADANKFIDNDPVSERVNTVTALLDIMAKGLSADEKNEAKKAIINLYASREIVSTDRASLSNLSTPTMKEFYTYISGLNNPFLDSVARKIWDYAEGPLSAAFKGHTNVNLDNKFTAIRIDPKNKDALPVYMNLAMNLVWNASREHRTDRMVIMEELWRVEEFPEAANYIREIFGLGRHFGIGPVAITHTGEQLAESKYSRSVLDNAQFMGIFRHDETTFARIQGLNLTQQEREWFKEDAGRGRLLWIDKLGTRDPIEVVLTIKEEGVFTTHPHEQPVIMSPRYRRNELAYLQGVHQSRHDLVEIIEPINYEIWTQVDQDQATADKWRTFETDKPVKVS